MSSVIIERQIEMESCGVKRSIDGGLPREELRTSSSSSIIFRHFSLSNAIFLHEDTFIRAKYQVIDAILILWDRENREFHGNLVCIF